MTAGDLADGYCGLETDHVDPHFGLRPAQEAGSLQSEAAKNGVVIHILQCDCRERAMASTELTILGSGRKPSLTTAVLTRQPILSSWTENMTP